MPLRIAFMGTPDFAVPSLAALLAAGHEIVAVYSQPGRPKGRGLAVEPSPVAKLALSRGLEMRTPESLKSRQEQEAFTALNLDAAVVVAYGLILPEAVLGSPRLGCFNLHASLLPRWRGAAPIQRAVMAGDKETGAMVMRITKGLDTGPVLLAEKTPIGRKSFGELHDELATSGAALMVRAIAGIEAGALAEMPQSVEGVTYARKIENQESRIDWAKDAHSIDCQVRGLSPVPGAWCEFGGQRLKILSCELADGSGSPGEILDDRLTVACGTGALRLSRLQRAGRAAMSADQFLRGLAVPRGTRLG
jgi:methionyl-tRNA formyltransferase